MDGQVFDQDERGRVRPVLEEAPLLPHEPVELTRLEDPEPTPEDEQVGARDGAGRVELQAAKVADDLEDSVRPVTGESLAFDREPPRGLQPKPAKPSYAVASVRSTTRNAGSPRGSL